MKCPSMPVKLQRLTPEAIPTDIPRNSLRFLLLSLFVPLIFDFIEPFSLSSETRPFLHKKLIPFVK